MHELPQITEDDLVRELENSDFRAVYFELLYRQTLIALETAVETFGSVRLGYQTREDAMNLCLQEAKDSQEFTDFINSHEDHPVPHTLLGYMAKMIEEFRNAEVENIPRPGASRPLQKGSDI